MTKVLLIDDLRLFRVEQENTSVVIARNSQEALDILKNDTTWDEIWFDHDLGEVHGVLDTTMVVVDYLCEKAFFNDPIDVKKVYIHTSNPVGRKQIKASMDRYGYHSVIVEPSTIFIVPT